MKKLIVSALCGLCLFGAFLSAATQPAVGEDASSEVAVSRKRIGVRS